jgi:hypothetical protein
MVGRLRTLAESVVWTLYVAFTFALRAADAGSAVAVTADDDRDAMWIAVKSRNQSKRDRYSCRCALPCPRSGREGARIYQGNMSISDDGSVRKNAALRAPKPGAIARLDREQRTRRRTAARLIDQVYQKWSGGSNSSRAATFPCPVVFTIAAEIIRNMPGTGIYRA